MNLLEGYHPGCIGRITQLHATFYAREAGFGIAFERTVAAGLVDFLGAYEPTRDGLWLAEEGGVVHASIAIDGTKHDTDGAHLRWFITSDEARGQRVGARLLDTALAFCRARGYLNVYLWTFDKLPAARHLYEKNGFELVRTQAGTQWGCVVNEQLFRLGHSGPIARA